MVNAGSPAHARLTTPIPRLRSALWPAARTALAAAVLAAAAAARPPQDNAHTAVKRLDMAWRDGVTPERMLALEQLSRFDDPLSVDELLSILARGEIAMFPAVRRVLGGYSQPLSIKRLVDHGLTSRDPVVRAQVLLALGDSRPASVDWVAITRRALDDTLPPVRAAAVSALGRARVEDCLTQITALAADPSERVRMEVPAALQRLAGARAMPVLESLLADPRWRVRLAAIHALGDLKTPEATARLVDALAAETGRLREDIAVLLARLTGRSLGLNVPGWLKFLATAPPDFLDLGDSAALEESHAPRYVDGPIIYYSVSTTSQRFVLLTDLSGSMDTPVAITGRDEPVPRLVATQEELARLIGSLTPEVHFDLVSFRDAADPWEDRLVAADERERRDALRAVEAYKAWGPTNIHAALAAVFDMAERALDAPTDRDQDLDTLFLLSDGVPTTGAIRDTSLLLQYVAERNRTLQLRIHCLSLTDEDESRDFLQRLATLTGGRYVELMRKGP